jgi:Transposase DDE domain group 1
MTQRNTDPLSFSSLGRRRLLADFTGGSLTSDAGALLLPEADKRLGLKDALDRVIPDPRKAEMISHSQRSLLFWTHPGHRPGLP